MNKKNIRVSFHSLGCKVNQYETESIKEDFIRHGYSISEDGKADLFVINTCTVTNIADRKSRQFIRRAARQNPGAVIAVTGCYVQIKPEDVAEIEGVKIIAGTDNKSIICDMADKWFDSQDRDNKGNPGENDDVNVNGDSVLTRVLPYEELTGYENMSPVTGMGERTRTYIKIQEGCNNFCTYCIIPYSRGRLRSRSEDSIIDEIKGFVEQGYKEIVLTGINTACYGINEAEEDSDQVLSNKKKNGMTELESLIARIDKMPGDFRIRLSSLEPMMTDAEEIARLLKYKRLCRHMHLALQSGSDKVLDEMNRHYDSSEFIGIVDLLRKKDPYYGLSSDIIVGFPGETEEDFNDSISVTRRSRFCKVHVFKYSMRDGTPAAERRNQVPGDVKTDRSHRLIEAAEDTAKEFFKDISGTERVVLIERSVQDPVTGESQGIENQEDTACGKVRTAAEADTCTGGKMPTEGGGTLLLTGYTDNYIKVYVNGSEELYNSFVRVRLDEPFADGMRGTIVGSYTYA